MSRSQTLKPGLLSVMMPVGATFAVVPARGAETVSSGPEPSGFQVVASGGNATTSTASASQLSSGGSTTTPANFWALPLAPWLLHKHRVTVTVVIRKPDSTVRPVASCCPSETTDCVST